MPYISKTQREEITKHGVPPSVPGELNFAISSLIDQYIDNIGGLSYVSLNTIIGVLECVKLEIYRRIGAPYEDEKLIENGEVFVKTKTKKV